MGVLDGQPVSAAITNPAFINKNQDDSMSNKLTFSRALSGATVSDIQAAVNKLYNATGASESATGTVYSAPANTITDGDSHQTALTDLADKFHPASGHMHTGTAGDAPPLPGTSISDVPFVQFVVAGTPITAVTGSSWDVTTEMTGKSPSTGSTDLGVVVTNPQNRVFLSSSNAATLTDCFVDATGNLVYGRLTESAGTWTLNFYSLIFGTETAFSFTSSVQIQWYFHELYEPLVSTPVYEPDYFDFEFRTVKTLAASGNTGLFGDVVIAASGGVNITQFDQTLLLTGTGSFSDDTPQDVAASGSPGIATSTSRSDHVHKGLHSIAASGYSQIFGDATLLAGPGMTISATGNTIEFIATATGGGGTTSPLTTKGDLYGFDTDNARIPVGASGQCLIADSNATLGVRYQDQIPKNFILESDAELATTVGWATYADVAATSPVDGTGGSPNITFAATGTNPIAGFYSYLITKDAANRQGEGVSYDFTVDRALLGKVVQTSFDYEPGTNWVASSGGLGFSDISMYCYDTTNAVLVPIQPLALTSGVGIQGTWMGEFQTNVTSQNYRLIAHIATTNANAWTFKFDNVYVGVPERAQGSPVTDWVSYTPTGNWNTNTTYTGRWRRVGDSMQIHAAVSLSGAPNSATFSLDIPTGYIIDTTKLAILNPAGAVGSGSILDSGVQVYPVSVYYASTTSINLTYGAANGAGVNTNNGVVNQANPTTFGSTDAIGMIFTVPITGWSSQTEMSSQADTRVVEASYGMTNAFSVGTSLAIVIFDTKFTDTHAAYSTSTGLFTVPVSGIYRISSSFATAAETVATNALAAQLNVYKNGVSFRVLNLIIGTGGTLNNYWCPGDTEISCVAGDTLAVYARVGTTGNISGTADNYITISRISGPATIASIETVAVAALRQTPTGTPSGTASVAIFGSLNHDTHASYNTTTGLYTVPSSGIYRMSANVEISSTAPAAGDEGQTLFYLNGTGGTLISIGIEQFNTGDNPRVFAQTTGQIRCVAGDTIGVYSRWVGSGTPSYSNSSTGSFFSIERIGL